MRCRAPLSLSPATQLFKGVKSGSLRDPDAILAKLNQLIPLAANRWVRAIGEGSYR